MGLAAAALGWVGDGILVTVSKDRRAQRHSLVSELMRVCVCVSLGNGCFTFVYLVCGMCGDQRTSWTDWVSPTVCALGIELGFLDLVAITITH